jgi:hypothetical protein
MARIEVRHDVSKCMNSIPGLQAVKRDWMKEQSRPHRLSLVVANVFMRRQTNLQRKDGGGGCPLPQRWDKNFVLRHLMMGRLANRWRVCVVFNSWLPLCEDPE